MQYRSNICWICQLREWLNEFEFCVERACKMLSYAVRWLCFQVRCWERCSEIFWDGLLNMVNILLCSDRRLAEIYLLQIITLPHAVFSVYWRPAWCFLALRFHYLSCLESDILCENVNQEPISHCFKWKKL